MTVGRPVKQTKEEFIVAIAGSSGIKMMIARRLKINRMTVDRYLKRWPAARAVYDQEVEEVGDIAESVIIVALKNSDSEMAKWYARVKLKDRGYAESVNLRHEGNEDKPVVVKHVGAAELHAGELAFLRSIGVKPGRLGESQSDDHPSDAGQDSFRSEEFPG